MSASGEQLGSLCDGASNVHNTLQPAVAALARPPAPLAPVNVAQLRSELQRNGPAMNAPGMADFAVGPPRPDDVPVRTGLGLFVTAGGRSTDLVARSGWAVDASVRPGEFQAGLGWRQSGVSAMVGYVQPDVTLAASHSRGRGWERSSGSA